jgi:hypothetical protein
MPHVAVTGVEERYCHLDCLLGNIGADWQEPEEGPGKTIRL